MPLLQLLTRPRDVDARRPSRRCRRQPRVSLLWALSALCLVMLSPTAAEGGPAGGGTADVSEGGSTEPSRAKLLFEQGIFASKEGRWEDAARALSGALELERRPITLYSLAVAERNLEQYAAALRHFREFLATPADPKMATFRTAAEETVEELEREVATVVISVRPRTEGLRVRVGQDALDDGQLDQPWTLDPGKHTITATAPGYGEARTTLTLTQGSASAIELELPRESSSTNYGPVVLMGIGGALFLGGATVGVIGMGEASGIDDPDDDAAISSARTKAIVGDVIGGVGLATVAIGVVWLLTSGDDVEEAALPIEARPGGVTLRF